MAAERIDTETARKLIAGGEVRVIDLRDEEEFSEVHATRAERIEDPDAESLAAELGEEDKVLVFCGDGERSASFAGELRERGVEAVSVEGGIEGWRSDGMPTQPSPDPLKEPEGPPTLPGVGS